MYAMFNLYIKKAADIYGIPRTRQIYEKAIEVLPEADSRKMCVLFAEMETKLGEIDRARAIYAHCSQMCDPRVTADFWQTWKEFEIRHGNEDTMREMLRIKRSIQATYNTQINMMSAALINAAVTTGEPPKDAMRALEVKAAETTARAIAAVGATGGNIMFVRGETQGGAAKEDRVVNPDEIDIDDEEEEEDDDDDEAAGDENGEDIAKKIPIERQSIPAKVFGSLRREVEEKEENDMAE